MVKTTSYSFFTKMSNPEFLTPKQIKPENIIPINPQEKIPKSYQDFLDFLEAQYLEEQERSDFLNAEANRGF